jgi:branched-chain amino acid transport system ATP-binding protein
MLQLKNFACGYGEFTAVDSLDLTVEAGSVFALMGPNGAGKSSTIMSIAGHVQVTQGSVMFDGEDITHLPARQRVHLGIAVAPEGRRLFPDLTTTENLTIGGYSRPKEEEKGNRDRVFDLFPRLAERADQFAGKMSGGEQQMLAIGRALMAKPKLLMIDEVSLGLMPKVIDMCYAALDSLRSEGITLLFVEQNTARALEVAEHVCVLESGKTVWKGSAADAKANPKLLDAFLGLTETTSEEQ